MKKIINWRTFLILLVMSLVSVILIFPYIISIQGAVLRRAGVSMETLFVAQFIQSIILFSVVIFLGLMFSKKIHFTEPFQNIKIGNIKNFDFLKPIGWGIATAVMIYLLDYVFSVLGVAISTHQNYAPIWQKLLAAFYGGIAEEIVMRLFFMTFIAWLIQKIVRLKKVNSTIIWISIILAAVIFGLGHLPITSSLTEITGLVVTRAILLNGIGGIVFGYLYWRKGLESAMLAHFTADIFLLTLLPLITS